jgi:hypothetical protein
LGWDVLTGKDDTIEFEDFLNGMSLLLSVLYFGIHHSTFFIHCLCFHHDDVDPAQSTEDLDVVAATEIHRLGWSSAI